MSRLQVLMLPYLYFKDFKQSSGVIHQSQIAQALQSAGMDVTMLLPSKEDGWKYDADEMFPGVTCQSISMPKNQMLYAGVAGDELRRKLTPTLNPDPFDVLLNCNPPTGLAYQRLLEDVAFTKCVPSQVLLYDNVTLASEFPPRRHVSPSYAPYLAALEAANTAAFQTVVTTYGELNAVRSNMRENLAPSKLREARLSYIPKPMSGITPTQRSAPTPGEPFRIFVARSMGTSSEDTCGLGPRVHETVFEAVRLLNISGTPVVLTAWTQSPMTPWLNSWVDKLGPALELHQRESRAQVMQGLADAHFAVDLRGYDGLYLSAIEQSMSGAIPIVLHSPWIDGEAQDSHRLSKLDPKELAVLIELLATKFNVSAAFTYESAKTAQQHHHLNHVGQRWGRVFNKHRLPFKPPALSLPLFETWATARDGTLLFAEACNQVQRLTKNGSFGRTTPLWVLSMFRAVGWDACRDENKQLMLSRIKA